MLKRDISLAKFSNYRIGGNARYFFEANSLPQLKKAIIHAREIDLSIFVLGGGTNILFSDSGFDGVVIKPNLNFIKTTFQHSQECWNVVVGAGTLMSDILNYTVKEGLSGLEWAGGLPGTLGGAIRGNAGCFGGEIKDNLLLVKVLEIPSKSTRQNLLKFKVIKFTNKECKFAYRNSIFKKNNKYIILEATLKLKKGDKKLIKKAIQEKINYRKEKHPLEYPNIGSIFKNVPVSSVQKNNKKVQQFIKDDFFPVLHTARLISEVGLRGVSYGGAMISPKHPNFIVNVQGATSGDVQNLIWLAKNKVKDKFGIDLEEEVIILL
ncbi:MAG: UDP-N-acetylmuramate dehydrogenase [bacterium]|nr:UDP-N-acetylmuramate dehydrogenase [bacterium]